MQTFAAETYCRVQVKALTVVGEKCACKYQWEARSNHVMQVPWFVYLELA